MFARIAIPFGEVTELEVDDASGASLARECQRALVFSHRLTQLPEESKRHGNRVDALDGALFVADLLLDRKGTPIQRLSPLWIAMGTIQPPQAGQGTREVSLGVRFFE